MYKIFQKNIKYLIVIIGIVVFVLSGYFDYIRETSFKQFTYPLDENIKEYVQVFKRSKSHPRRIINEYKYDFLITPDRKCLNQEKLRLVLVIKSSLDNFKRREAIRQTWGDEDRFPGIEIRRFFMVGKRESNNVNKMIQNESNKYNDLIQGDFIDAYYNNTIKTMMSFKWLLKNCDNSNFYMFLDDDYYVSILNVLSYIKNPVAYPKYLNDRNHGTNQVSFEMKYFYSGNCLHTRPMRDYFSKYRLSLNEYPFDEFPVFSTAGAYILSRTTLEELYYASFYTKHFRFDDVYLGILSRKIGIVPYHSKYIVGEWKENDDDFKQYCIASHGFDDVKKMVRLWNTQRNLGYA